MKILKILKENASTCADCRSSIDVEIYEAYGRIAKFFYCNGCGKSEYHGDSLLVAKIIVNSCAEIEDEDFWIKECTDKFKDILED